MRRRSLHLSLALIFGTIAAGLALRLIHVGLPFVVVKYGGSILWAMMIYWIATTCLPRWPAGRSALLAAGISAAVELFKLVQTPALDTFRRTLPGMLLLGRIFSLWDLLAYAIAIVLGMRLDRAIRSRG